MIDTPGLLDHPLEERNTIEMQSITALAHIRACVMFIVDISEQCGYTIEQQSQLCKSIKPLFANKPLIVAFNKTDVKKVEDLGEDDRKIIEELADLSAESLGKEREIWAMSTMTDDNVMKVRNTACDALLQHRVEQVRQERDRSLVCCTMMMTIILSG